jgi:Flp pilus assembly protein TadG
MLRLLRRRKIDRANEPSCAGGPLAGRLLRRRRQGGNAILEGALIFLPMMALFLGLVDISFAIFIQSTLTSSTRAAARAAVTFPATVDGTSCSSSQTTCIIQAVQDNAVGVPNLSTSYITVNYYTAANLTTPVASCNFAGTCTYNSVCGSSGAASCSNGSLDITLSSNVVVNYVNQPGNIVQVQVSGYPWNWMAPMPGFYAGTGLTMSAISVDVLGGLAPGVGTPPNP